MPPYPATMRLLDAFFAARPLVLIPAWSFFILGAETDAATGLPVLRLFLLSLVLLATHLLNQVVDFESDRLNHKGFFLQQGVFRQRHYMVAATLLMSVALGVSWARREGAVLLSLAAILGLAYNLRPLQWSHRPVVDLLANAIGYGGVAYLLAQTAPINRGLSYEVLATTCSVGAVFLHTTLLDLDGDRRDAKITSGVWLGERRARVLAAVLATTALAAAGMSSIPLLIVPCALLAMLTWFASSQRISVWGTTLFAIAAAVAIWWFAIVVLLLVLVTRLYYARRFRLRYPSF